MSKGLVKFNVVPGSPDYIHDLFEDVKDVPQRDLNKIYCSYCNREISHVNSVEGNDKLRFVSIQEIEYVNGVEVLKDKMVASTKKVTSCHDCCLKVHKIKSHMRG